MEIWILILTIATSNGVAISTIEGFTSEDVCNAAGTKWTEELNDKKIGLAKMGQYAVPVCAKIR